MAIGNFDGVHIGHRQIMDRLLRRSRRVRGSAAVLTFFTHPRAVLSPRTPPHLLTPGHERLRLLSALGVDRCYLIRFTKRFSALSPEDFVRQLLVARLNVHTVYMGSNARFGHRRTGSVGTMRRLAGRYGFSAVAVPPRKLDGAVVNSSRIRTFIQSGKIRKATRALGRPPSFTGKVVKGSARGTSLGFPTANLRPDGNLLPKRGVYAVRVDIVRYRPDTPVRSVLKQERIIRRSLSGVLNVGYRPTFSKSAASSLRKRTCEFGLTAEVFLIGFRGNLYGKHLKVHIISHLRNERKFKHRDALIAQISRDVRNARKYL